MKILVINGPNLQLLGTREPDIYGASDLSEINAELARRAENNSVSIDFFQSNHEGVILDKIAEAQSSKVDLIIINPAAYTHTSIAIRDALSAAQIPTIEVHLSNIYSREEFRHESLIAPVCIGQISGFGKNSYFLALDAGIAFLQSI